MIKNYFVNYNEFVSNDFVLSKGGKELRVFNSDIDDWTVTFVDTGANSNIGQRLKAVEKYLEDEEVFLANYSDNLTDFHLPHLIQRFHESKKLRRSSFPSWIGCAPRVECAHLARHGPLLSSHRSAMTLVANANRAGSPGRWLRPGFYRDGCLYLDTLGMPVAPALRCKTSAQPL